MGSLAFSSHDIAKIAPKIEQQLREDLGTKSPIPYVVGDGDNAGAAVAEFAKALFAGRTETLGTLVFDVPGLKPFCLQIGVDREGLGARLGPLLYSAALGKPLAGEVELAAPKLAGKAKFVGDATAAGRLNGRADLLKRVNKFTRTKAEFNAVTAMIPRLFKIMPHDGGALLVAQTFPRPKKLGFSESLDAREFADLAAAIEAAM